MAREGVVRGSGGRGRWLGRARSLAREGVVDGSGGRRRWLGRASSMAREGVVCGSGGCGLWLGRASSLPGEGLVAAWGGPRRCLGTASSLPGRASSVLREGASLLVDELQAGSPAMRGGAGVSASERQLGVNPLREEPGAMNRAPPRGSCSRRISGMCGYEQKHLRIRVFPAFCLALTATCRLRSVVIHDTLVGANDDSPLHNRTLWSSTMHL
jgi:hypothetical protein